MARPRRSGLPLLEAMGFSDRDIPTLAPLMVAVAPLTPVRLAPALTSSHVTTRPLPSRPPARPPSTVGTFALVNALWNDSSPDPRNEAKLLPPQPMSLESRRRSRGGTVTMIAVIIAVLTGAGGFTYYRSQAAVRSATDRAGEAQDVSHEVAAELVMATAVIADPSAPPSDLSAAAGTITRLSAVSVDLLGIGREVFPARIGAQDPLTNRDAFLLSGERGTELERAMSQLLTTRLVLEDLIELPHLTTEPGEAARVGADLAAAVSRAEARLIDIPETHAAISDDARATLTRIAERAAIYSTDLRNGEPVGGHLSSFDAEVTAFATRLNTYVVAQATALEDLRAAYEESLANL